MLSFILIALCLLVLLLGVRTLAFPLAAGDLPEAAAPPPAGAEAAQRLAGALRFATVSHDDPGKVDAEAFLRLHSYLRETYPLVHDRLRCETVNGLSLLYTWPGSDPQKPPLLLLAHQDVVPVDPHSEEEWTHPPFAGVVRDGFIWGRGALDFKAGLVGILEAVEGLLAGGFHPERTIYLAFGHDEEVGGSEGAARIAALLAERGVRLGLVLDEGGMVAEDLVPGTRGPVALAGVAEKGFATVDLRVRSHGGHSSMPCNPTAIAILGRAVARIEGYRFPARLELLRLMFRHLGRRLGFVHRLVWANLWLFGPVLKSRLARSPELNASVRTSAAATLIAGGIKENVIPGRAEATVNLRLMPGDMAAGAVAALRRAVADERIELRLRPDACDPSPVTDATSPAFALVRATLRQACGVPDLPFAPYLVIGATDSRHFAAIADQILLFQGGRLQRSDLQLFHGSDERLSVANFGEIIAFYRLLIVNCQKRALSRLDSFCDEG